MSGRASIWIGCKFREAEQNASTCDLAYLRFGQQKAPLVYVSSSAKCGEVELLLPWPIRKLLMDSQSAAEAVGLKRCSPDRPQSRDGEEI